MPVQTDRFRASDCDKQELDKISREYFENVVKNEQMKVVLSGYLHSDTILNNCVRLRLSKFSNQLNQDVLQEVIIPAKLLTNLERCIVHGRNTFFILEKKIWHQMMWRIQINTW